MSCTNPWPTLEDTPTRGYIHVFPKLSSDRNAAEASSRRNGAQPGATQALLCPSAGAESEHQRPRYCNDDVRHPIRFGASGIAPCNARRPRRQDADPPCTCMCTHTHTGPCYRCKEKADTDPPRSHRNGPTGRECFASRAPRKWDGRAVEFGGAILDEPHPVCRPTPLSEPLLCRAARAGKGVPAVACTAMRHCCSIGPHSHAARGMGAPNCRCGLNDPVHSRRRHDLVPRKR